MSWNFLTSDERRAYGLVKHLRNAGLSPELHLGRSPCGRFIYRSKVTCECDQWQWEWAVDRMYAERAGVDGEVK